jgi:hypothetical protein
MTQADCTTPLWDCIPFYTGSTRGYSNCAPHCNPLAPFTADATHTACTTGEGCNASFHTQGATYCFTADGKNGGDGASCTGLADCAPAFVCAINNNVGTCRAWCSSVGSQAQCPTGKTCTAFQNPPYDNQTELGVCQ